MEDSELPSSAHRTPADDGAEVKAIRVARLIGPVARNDRETVEFWRRASAADHARAMIDLAEYAEMISRHTGYRRDPADALLRLPVPSSTRPR